MTERRFWSALADIAERRIRLIIAAHETAHFTGPAYDPNLGSSGDGRTCFRCRKVSRSDARVCGSCGQILRAVIE